MSHKTIILGEANVGKTNIVLRLCNNEFNKYEQATISCTFQLIKMGDKLLELWDTCGQEKFDALIPMYYRDAKVVLIVYDVTDEHSINKANYWIKKIKEFEYRARIILVANKIDLKHKIKTNKIDELKELTNQYIEISAKEGKHLDTLKQYIIDEINIYNEVSQQVNMWRSKEKKKIVSLNEKKNKKKKSWCPC